MTPDEQIAVIRARAEGKKIEKFGKHLMGGTWKLMTRGDFDFQDCDYRIAPSPIASGHNPDKLTVEQVGEGWRLLAEEEIVTRKAATRDIQMWGGEWCTYWCMGDAKSRTYRTQKPEGYFLPKKKVKVEGWINMYKNGQGYLYPSKEAADALTTSKRIACKHIVFEVTEGEGL